MRPALPLAGVALLLKSGPKGAKKFHSETAATDYTFRRRLTVPGRYRIVCTLHDEMTMRIRVKR
jgi:plastocyanin